MKKSKIRLLIILAAIVGIVTLGNSNFNNEEEQRLEYRIDEDNVKQKTKVAFNAAEVYIRDITDALQGLADVGNKIIEHSDAGNVKSSVLEQNSERNIENAVAIGEIPDYNGDAYITINENVPFFSGEEKASVEVFEYYSELDFFGRCGVAYANLCPELMPTEKRGEIGMIKPSGWQTAKYDFVDGKYLYNRCHLIGYQLSGENANERNLITGTRYLNVEGMLPFENEVADYIHETSNHVLYRVTPIYTGNNLVVDGVEMEAWSVEDAGCGICFNVYAYNVQPGVEIDYSTGENWLAE